MSRMDFSKYDDIPEGLEFKKKDYNEWITQQLTANPELIKDWLWRITHLYYITTKTDGVALFFPNRAQKVFIPYLDMFDRFVILKSRQLGFSTFVAIYFLDKILFEENKDAGFIANTSVLAGEIFDKKVMYAIHNLPECIKSRLNFENKSAKKLKILKKSGAANNYNVLNSTRGGTYQYTHISELGKIAKAFPLRAKEILGGSMGSIAAGNKLFIESTAEGASGLFYDTFMDSWKIRNKFVPGSAYAKMLCYPLFFDWRYDQDEIASVDEIIPVSDMTILDIDWSEFQKDNNLSDVEITWYYLKWLQKKKDTGLLFQEYPTNVEDAFLASGQCMFPQRKISELLLNADETKPVNRYDLWSGELTVNKDSGRLHVYREPLPGRRYTIGADTGQGLSDGDFSVATVVDDITKEPVAFFVIREEPYDFATSLNILGRYYNNALMAVESNQNGYYVNDRLVKDFNYPSMYLRQRYDSISRTYSKEVGWDTKSNTRQKALNDFKAVFNMNDFWYYKPLLEEMMTFVANRRGKFEAVEGSHDDIVMATSIAYGVIGAQTVKKHEIHTEKVISREALAFGECTIEEFLEKYNK